MTATGGGGIGIRSKISASALARLISPSLAVSKAALIAGPQCLLRNKMGIIFKGTFGSEVPGSVSGDGAEGLRSEGAHTDELYTKVYFDPQTGQIPALTAMWRAGVGSFHGNSLKAFRGCSELNAQLTYSSGTRSKFPSQKNKPPLGTSETISTKTRL